MNKRKAFEGFCGYRNMSKELEKVGFTVRSVDNDSYFEGAEIKDILTINPESMKDYYLMWFSPPCTGFSVASIGTHWGGGYRKYIPQTDTVKLGLKLLEHSIKIIALSKPKKWYIENPRGVMRKVIDGIFKKHGVGGVIRHTVTYCQYGDNRMKPTDIWTNDIEWKPKPMCKNGDTCHVSAPRGSKTGTQGLKGSRERSMIPIELCREISQLNT